MNKKNKKLTVGILATSTVVLAGLTTTFILGEVSLKKEITKLKDARKKIEDFKNVHFKNDQLWVQIADNLLINNPVLPLFKESFKNVQIKIDNLKLGYKILELAQKENEKQTNLLELENKIQELKNKLNIIEKFNVLKNDFNNLLDSLPKDSNFDDLREKVKAEKTAINNFDLDKASIKEITDFMKTETAKLNDYKAQKDSLMANKNKALEEFKTALQQAIDLSNKPTTKDKYKLDSEIRKSLSLLLAADTTTNEEYTAQKDKLLAAIQEFNNQSTTNPAEKEESVQALNKLISEAETLQTENAEAGIQDEALDSSISKAKEVIQNKDKKTKEEVDAAKEDLTQKINSSSEALKSQLTKQTELKIQILEELFKLKQLKLPENSDYAALQTSINNEITKYQNIIDNKKASVELLTKSLVDIKSSNESLNQTKTTIDNSRKEPIQEFEEAKTKAFETLKAIKHTNNQDANNLLNEIETLTTSFADLNTHSKEEISQKIDLINKLIAKALLGSTKAQVQELIDSLPDDAKYNTIKENLNQGLTDANNLAADAKDTEIQAANTALQKVLQKAIEDKKTEDAKTSTPTKLYDKALVEAYDKQATVVNNYIKTDLSDEKYKDLNTLLTNTLNEYNAIVHPTDDTNLTDESIKLATHELISALENIKLKKQIRDLETSENPDIKSPNEYIGNNKTTDEALIDYETQLNKSKSLFIDTVKQLMDTYPTENHEGSTVDTYPSSYKEQNLNLFLNGALNEDYINNNLPSMPSRNEIFIKKILSEIKWIQEAKVNKSTNNIEISRKINEFKKLEYEWLIKTQTEEKIEAARQNVFSFIQGLNEDKYASLVKKLKTNLQLNYSSTNTTNYMFDSYISNKELKEIYKNLLLVLSEIPGALTKIDFMEKCEFDQKFFLPSLEKFYDENEVINATENPWVEFLKHTKIKEFTNQIYKWTNEELKTIPDKDYLGIREKINEYNTLKNQYKQAFEQAIKYYTHTYINKYVQEKLGTRDLNGLIETLKKYPSTNTKHLKQLEHYATDITNILNNIENIYKTIGANIMVAGASSRSMLQTALDSQAPILNNLISSFAKELFEISKVLEKELKDQKAKYYKNENYGLKGFIEDVQKNRENIVESESNPNIFTLFNTWENSILDSRTHADKYGDHILATIVDHMEKAKIAQTKLNDLLPTYIKQYITKTWNTDNFKDELDDLFIKQQIGYILGTSNKHIWNGFIDYYSNHPSVTGTQNPPYFTAATVKCKTDNSHINSDGYYVNDDNVETLSLKSINYANDFSHLLSKKSTILTESNEKILNYGYALFLLKKYKKGTDIYYDTNIKTLSPELPYNTIINLEDWDIDISRNSYKYYSFFGSDKSYSLNHGIYWAISYMLLGLIKQYEDVYNKQHNDAHLDLKWYNDDKTLKNDNDLTIAQKAQKTLDIFGINTMKYWMGAKDYDRANGYFTTVEDKQFINKWNAPQTIIREIPINFYDLKLSDLQPDDTLKPNILNEKDVQTLTLPDDFKINNITYVNKQYTTTGTTILADNNNQVSTQQWYLNGSRNIFNVYCELYKELIKLNESANNSTYLSHKGILKYAGYDGTSKEPKANLRWISEFGDAKITKASTKEDLDKNIFVNLKKKENN